MQKDLLPTGGTVSAMGGPSHEAIVLGSALEKASTPFHTVLDLGCGDGRNSFMLSGLGLQVTAVDSSSEKINQLQQLIENYPRKLSAVKSDVTLFKFTSSYGAVLAHGLLHFLSKSEIARIISKIQDATLPGGINIFTTAFYQKDTDIIDDFKKAGHQNALQENDLLSFYKKWEVISHEVYQKWDWHPETAIHCHPIQKNIFRKPGEHLVSLTSTEILLNEKKHPANDALSADIIGCQLEEILTKYGKPDIEYEYIARGPQFSHKVFDFDGYILKLGFYDNKMIYSSNGVISGYSEFKSNFYALTS